MEPTIEHAIVAAGYPAANIPPDGQIHRFGKHKEFWAVNFENAAGAFGNWKTGTKETWSAGGNDLTPEERHRMNKTIEDARRQRQAEQEEKRRSVAGNIRQQMDALVDTGASDYLALKKVQGYDGVRYGDGYIMIPMRDVDGAIWNAQTIYDDRVLPEKLKAQGRNKDFPYGGRKKGLFFAIGSLTDASAAYVVEGYATGATVHAATGLPVVVAFDAGNLAPVIEAIQTQHSGIALIIAGDDDQWKPETGNTGRMQAEEAAKRYGCAVVFPWFFGSLEKEDLVERKPTDFNDLHMLAGLEEVTRQLSAPERARESDEDVVTRLAGLSPLDYARQAKEAAQTMGVNKSDIDKAVREHKALLRTVEAGSNELFPLVEPCSEAVDGAALLEEVATTLRRYAILPDHADIALALWVMFTWLIDAVKIAPILAISSPEKQCGKTTVLSLVGQLVSKALPTSNITPAAMFRAIERWQPTMLIDEADTFIKEAEELRGVLNSGHTKATAFVIRTVGDDHEPTRFSTWGAKAIALIGKLPETLHDRSIVIELRRKLAGEATEKLRYSDFDVFIPLRAKLQRFANDHREAIRDTKPLLPSGISDRAQDNWEPLLAIAELAGGRWPEKATAAALALSARENAAASIGTELLADIELVFDDKGIERIASKDLIEKLCEDEERPWVTYNRGKPVSPRQIGRFLREYGIESKNIKMFGGVKKGFEREQFTDAFARYLHTQTPPENNRYPLPAAETLTTQVADNESTNATRYHKATQKTNVSAVCSGRTDNLEGTGREEYVL